MNRYKILSLLMIISLCLLSFRIFYISYYNSETVSAVSNTSLEVFGTKRGLIFDRNLVRLVENETQTVSSTENPSFSFEMPLRYNRSVILPHIIGYVNGDNNGVVGIEKDYNTFLKSIPNEIRLITFKDASGRILKGKGTQIDLTHHQLNSGVVLTIDQSVQTVLEKVGTKVKKGAAIVLNAKNGDILGLASFPSFDPSNPGWYLHDTDQPFINRALSRFNVGSVFKIVVAMAALENGISPHFSYNCTGKCLCGGTLFHCHKTDGHGKLDLKHAIAYSCNTYFIELAKHIGGEKILQMCEKLKLHKQTVLSQSIINPCAILPSLKNLSSAAGLANFSFGQGELSASPLTIANLYSVIANGGFLQKNRLVLGTLKNGKMDSSEHTKGFRVIQKSTSIILDECLRYTVFQGTGTNAYSDRIFTAGKTATAQTGQIFNRSEKLISYFVGYCRIKGDIYTVLVMKEGGTSGSQDCAPIFKSICESMIL